MLLAAVGAGVPYPMVTSDPWLVAIFGGVFVGIGTEMAMRGGAALGGIEALARYTGIGWPSAPARSSSASTC